MRLHDIFFWLACFFLAGVFVASVVSGFSQVYLIAAIIILLTATTIFLFKRPLLSYMIAAVLVMFLGAVYYFGTDYYTRPGEIVFDQKVKILGIILEAEQRLNSQKLVLVYPRDRGDARVQITTSRYPEFDYGDEIKAIGVIKKPVEEWKGYFAKEGIAGLMQFPEITLISQNNGSPLKAGLLKIKSFFESSFKKVLPFERATFLAGLTLGDTSEFSDEFKEKLRLTGTTHLVALSGYNISVIVIAVNAVLGMWWLTKKFRLPISVLLILGFVIMTGAEASVVRAAIMAGLVLLADKIGRVFYVRNAIAAVALAMVLINPKILAFDVGFQLSFAALLGIIYLEPWLRRKLKVSDKAGFFGWRKNLMTTTSAQFAVLPLIIYHFSYFSPISILSNILILEFIPITMSLGFFIGFASIISYHLAWLISWPASIFLGYELGIINLFATIVSFF